MTELNLCPYCSGKPRFWPSFTKADIHGCFESIGCYNENCPVEPTTGYMSYPAAVETWNALPSMAGDTDMNNDRATETLLLALINEHLEKGKEATSRGDDNKAFFEVTIACGLLDTLFKLTGHDSGTPAYDKWVEWYDRHNFVTVDNANLILNRAKLLLEDYQAATKRRDEEEAANHD